MDGNRFDVSGRVVIITGVGQSIACCGGEVML